LLRSSLNYTSTTAALPDLDDEHQKRGGDRNSDEHGDEAAERDPRPCDDRTFMSPTPPLYDLSRPTGRYQGGAVGVESGVLQVALVRLRD
jgi:hypothetical protein